MQMYLDPLISYHLMIELLKLEYPVENRQQSPRIMRVHKGISQVKVCSLLEWCFVISIEVSSDHSQLRCTGFAGSH